MARLNTRTARSPTNNSLYRTTPRPRFADSPDSGEDEPLSESTPPTPTQLSILFEKENAQNGSMSSKAMGKAKASASNGQSIVAMRQVNGTKRRRLDDRNTPSAEVNELLTQFQGHREDIRNGENFYDPDQPEDLRVQLRLGMRHNQQELRDRRDEFANKPAEFINLLKKQDAYMKAVRQTSDAAIDSRFQVEAVDIALKHTTSELLGHGSLGVDMDEFVSKCITFMRNGGPLNTGGDDESSPSQPARRRGGRAVVDDDDDLDDGDALPWNVLGERAAFPSNCRPPAPSFLLGPLSVEKRARNTQRSGRQRRDPESKVTKPQELRAEDLERNESSNLTSLCKGIRERLDQVIQEGIAGVTEELNIEEEVDDETAKTVFKRHHLAMNYEVSLFEFVINPWSFAQTVENLFYVSFLVKDGFVKVDYDEDKLPTIRTIHPESAGGHEGHERARQQAIFTLDFATYNKLIEAFDIKEALIPNRVEEAAQVGASGWYG